MDEQDQIHVVWVQLYIGEHTSGATFKIKAKNDGDIDDLKVAVKKERADDLAHCHAAKLMVYEFKEEDILRPGIPVPRGTTDLTPLRVVAPVKHPGKDFMVISFLPYYTCSMHT
jgi:hypothetical protein